MCGFLGTLPASEPAKFAKALSLLTHRGPDAKGLWTDKSKISLGHRTPCNHRHNERCSATNASARSLFDGIQWEIYNFLELKRELEDLGERF